MAEVLFATTEAKAKVERVSRARTTSVTNWTSWLPFRSLSRWTPKYLNGDLVAGFTLAAIAIPEQMATARLGGFAPEIGFFVFVAGSLAFAVFGASRHLSAGADSTITPLFAGGLALLAATGSPQYLALAATLAVDRAILLESAMSFFGVGVQPPTASWGNMLYQAQTTMSSEPWLGIFPGAFIFLTVLCCNVLGSSLTDVEQAHK